MPNELEKVETYHPAVVEDAGVGSEMGAEDLALPFIKIVQGLSPELNPNKEGYIREAKQGDYINSATQRIYGRIIDLIIVRYEHRLNEWKPRAAGGGLVNVYPFGQMPADAKEVLDATGKRRVVRNNGNVMEEAMYYFSLIKTPIEADFFDKGVISFKSTGLKTAKKLNMTIQSQKVRNAEGKTVPMAIFSQIYRLSTVSRENAQGSWFGVSFIRVGPVDPASAAYAEAKAFNLSAAGRKIHGEEGSVEGEEVVVEGTV